MSGSHVELALPVFQPAMEGRCMGKEHCTVLAEEGASLEEEAGNWILENAEDIEVEVAGTAFQYPAGPAVDSRSLQLRHIGVARMTCCSFLEASILDDERIES